ncbi:AIPR family protein [Lactiplantibacillus plantarum]|uniref:AIPR family protein n=1 Tax=Lactiplantibacillus plantarum TaxID=1590 RepID=UPI0031B707FD
MKNNEEMKFTIPYASAVRIKSPYPSSDNYTWHAYVNVKDMPKNIPTEVNPRETNMKTKVAKNLVNSLETSDQSFYKKNRGILFSTKKVINSMGALIVDMGKNNDDDKSKYGILDGGHTYKAIIDNNDTLDDTNVQFVHLEIMTAIDDIDSMASARNSSVQVDDKAIAELANKFEFIKEAIKNEPFSNNISYKQNENKDIDTVDIVRIMYALNIFKYPETSLKQPIQSYSGKAQVLKDYLSEYDRHEKSSSENPYKKLAILLPSMARLYDTIEQDIGQAYKEGTEDGKARFGKVKGVEAKPGTSKYYKNPIDYQVSQGLLFPILGGFRALIKEDDNSVEWEIDPIKIWKKTCVKLVANTISMSRQLGNNPQSAGKSSTLWSQNFDTINTAKMKEQMRQLSKG